MSYMQKSDIDQFKGLMPIKSRGIFPETLQYLIKTNASILAEEKQEITLRNKEIRDKAKKTVEKPQKRLIKTFGREKSKLYQINRSYALCLTILNSQLKRKKRVSFYGLSQHIS